MLYFYLKNAFGGRALPGRAGGTFPVRSWIKGERREKGGESGEEGKGKDPPISEMH